MTTDWLLQAADLRVTYQTAAGALAAVRGVSLGLARGETLGLVGESGCGKSTLARALLGLERLAAGSVHFDGAALQGASPATLRALRRRFQPVFQDPGSALDPRMSVGASIAEPLGIHRVGTRAERRRRVAALLEAVQLPQELAARLPAELSSGQRQRVALARALALEPELLLLDEPVSALDVSVQAQLLNLLAALKRARGLTLLFISHDLDVVAWLADRVAVMYAGRLVEVGAVADVVERPRHPYTRALLDARPGRQPSGAPLPPEPPSPLDVPAGCAFAARCPLAQDRCRRDDPSLQGAPQLAACHFPLR